MKIYFIFFITLATNLFANDILKYDKYDLSPTTRQKYENLIHVKTIFSCPESKCLFFFKNFQRYVDHFKNKHLQRGFCTFCQISIPFSYASDTMHAINHIQQFECKACGFKSNCKEVIFKHIIQNHNES